MQFSTVESHSSGDQVKVTTWSAEACNCCAISFKSLRDLTKVSQIESVAGEDDSASAEYMLRLVRSSKTTVSGEVACLSITMPETGSRP